MTFDKSYRIGVNYTPLEDDIYAEKHIKTLNDSGSKIIKNITKEIQAQSTIEYKTQLLTIILINVITRFDLHKTKREDFLKFIGVMYDQGVAIKKEFE